MPQKKQFSVQIENEICRRLMSGESLRVICEDERMPSVATVYRWLSVGTRSFRKRFYDSYCSARVWQKESLVELVEEVASDPELTSEIRKAKMDALKLKISQLESTKYGREQKVVVKVKFVNQLDGSSGKQGE